MNELDQLKTQALLYNNWTFFRVERARVQIEGRQEQQRCFWMWGAVEREGGRYEWTQSAAEHLLRCETEANLLVCQFLSENRLYERNGVDFDAREVV